ncbi:hypothetical protein B9K06_12605 [Bacillus sp. OG2]|nr:hypothetical protein B9K06_12605 [Bacillus sp. OG2]
MKILIRVIFSLVFCSILYNPQDVFAHGPEKPKELATLTFVEHWNPFLLILVVLITWVYFYLQRRWAASYLVSSLRRLSFVLGLITLFIVFGSPLHILGDSYLFSAHMLQQSLVYIVMPPLLLLGLPKPIVAFVLVHFQKFKFFKLLTNPLISLVLFNVLFSFYHIPIIFDTLVSNTVYHSFSHIILTITAFLMWIPVIPPTKSTDVLSNMKKIAYLFGAGVLLTPACALIIFAENPIYQTYSDAPQIFAWLSPIDDQQLGGVIMKVVQEIMFGFIIGYVFFKWTKEERLKDKFT